MHFVRTKKRKKSLRASTLHKSFSVNMQKSLKLKILIGESKHYKLCHTITQAFLYKKKYNITQAMAMLLMKHTFDSPFVDSNLLFCYICSCKRKIECFSLGVMSSSSERRDCLF